MTSSIERDAVSSHVSVRDGTRIGYSLYGQRDGVPRVVLLHSLAMDRAFWQPVVERLVPHAAVLALDCRGHGASDKPAGPYTVAQFAADVRDVVTALDFGGVLIAGASMGGCVSIAFAAAFGNRVKGLGLIDTTAWYGPEAQANWEQRGQ